jgi:hypothetical protein
MEDGMSRKLLQSMAVLMPLVFFSLACNLLSGIKLPGQGELPTDTPKGISLPPDELPTVTPEEISQPPTELPTVTPESTSQPPEELPTDTPEAAHGTWVLKFTQPNAGETEVPFSFPGLECVGGTTATSTETTATITTTGACWIPGALYANQTTQHSWSRPPDQLQPGQEFSGDASASSSGLCGWQDSMTEESCRSYVTTSFLVWQGDGWPGSPDEFGYQNLIFGEDNEGTAQASDKPIVGFSWTVPAGSLTGGKTLVLQFGAHSSGGQVYTNFWYEWSAD